MLELPIRRFPRRWPAAALVLLFAACGPDGPSAPQLQDPQELLWAVRLDHHAITLAASGDQSTIQLAPVGVNGNGGALPGAQFTYSLSDSEVVSVDANGLVTARRPANAVQLIASSSIGNVTKKDTAYLNIVDITPAPVLDAFTLSLASGGITVPASDAFNFFGNDQAMVTGADAGGIPIDGLPAYFTSSDPTTLTVDHASGAVHAIRPGEVTLTATTIAFGVAKTSSMTITVGSPALGVVGAFSVTPIGSPTPVLVFQPAEVTVSVGASVFFANQSSTQAIDVVFDNPTDVAESPIFPMGAGNIEPFKNSYSFRAFPKPGTYTYHSTLFNTNGRIIVQ